MRIRPRSLGLAMLAAWSISLSATMFVPLSIKELAGEAQLVVRGTVLSKSCQRDEAGRIYTRVELKIAEVWKGRVTGDHLTVVQGGGVLGNRKTVVVGQVDYRIGEEVVAFLVLNSRGEAVTVGLAQGKFHVWTDPATGQKLARNLFHGGAPAGAGGARLQNAAEAAAPLTVEELKREVQAQTEAR